jgi:hypothetical protein
MAKREARDKSHKSTRQKAKVKGNRANGRKCKADLSSRRDLGGKEEPGITNITNEADDTNHRILDFGLEEIRTFLGVLAPWW